MKKQFTIVLVTLISVGVIGFLLWSQKTSAEPLTEELAKQLVDERYGGEITDIQLVDNEFHINITLPTGIYELKIDRSNGDVTSMERVEAIEVKEELTEEEVRQTIIENESGEIRQIEKKNNEERTQYEAKVESEQANIMLVIDAYTGEVIDRKEEKKSKEQQPEKPKENKKKNSTSQKYAKGVTEADAKRIALETVDPKRIGEIDDVDLEEVNGQIYYFVEVEFEEGDDAIVKINAITGEAISIDWDD